MRIASVPYNEDLRLQDLYSYDILDSEGEKEFDDILEMAADICKCPIAAISFVDENRQWFKSKKGIEDSQTSREIAFCAHTILEDKLLQVKDATLDERFSDNPLVTGNLYLRFYAGVPIISESGFNLGSVCVIDHEPKELTPEQHKILIILSQHVSKLLELRIKNKLLKKSSIEQLQYEKELMQKTLQKQEIEKSAISTELHENVAQSIAATKFYLEIAEGATTNKDELIKKSRSMLATLLKEVQDLSKVICPTTLKDIYLKDTLEYLLQNFSKKNAIDYHLIYEAGKELNPELAIASYRIVEEQLNNIKLHSKATSVIVNIHIFQSLFISIKDNGIGFDLKEFKKGVGINKILSRVDNFHGTVDISGGFNRGCELIITIPLYKESSNFQLVN